MRNIKEIQRFNEIADILGIKFEEAEELSKIVRTTAIELNEEYKEHGHFERTTIALEIDREEK